MSGLPQGNQDAAQIIGHGVQGGGVTVFLNMSKLRFRLIDETLGGGDRRGERATAGDEIQKLRGRNAILREKEGVEFVTLFWGGILKQEQHGQCELSGGNVGAKGLADHLFIPDEIDTVIQHLIGDSDLCAVVFKGADDGG